MRTSTVVMIAFAVVFGLLAVFVAQTWLASQAEMRMKNIDAQKKPIATNTIVVANRTLQYGVELDAAMLREMTWPTESMPAGAFATISEFLSAGRRVVLTPIEPNEPVLAVKVTGPGQRATLSALVGEGMKAVTVRVSDVEGVGGFVLPGDRVDVVMTRQVDKGNATTEVVLQDTRVLAIDQSADTRSAKPAVAKAVTLEVNTVGAQKVWLAASVGTLSLLLRKAGETGSERTRRVTLDDLSTLEAPRTPDRDTGVTTVSVTRASSKQVYSVPIEGEARRTASGGGKSVRR